MLVPKELCHVPLENHGVSVLGGEKTAEQPRLAPMITSNVTYFLGKTSLFFGHSYVGFFFYSSDLK